VQTAATMQLVSSAKDGTLSAGHGPSQCLGAFVPRSRS
jgi:hypothetical protein